MKTNPLFIFATILFFAFNTSFAQQVIFNHQYFFDDSEFDCVNLTNDGGFILTGRTDVGDGATILKTNSSGIEEWRKIYHELHHGQSIQQTNDGGYVMLGQCYSPNVGVVLMKTDASGDSVWTRILPGTTGRFDKCVIQANDHGYIITYIDSIYMKLVKFDSSGNLQWSKSFSGQGTAGGSSVQQTTDGGYIVSGYTYQGLFNSQQDVFILKTNSGGIEEWHNYYPRTGYQEGACVLETSDHGFVFTAMDVLCVGNIFLAKTDSIGTLIWTNTTLMCDSGDGHYVYTLCKTSDGGFVIGGQNSFIGDLLFVIKTDHLGNKLWQYNPCMMSGSEYAKCMSVLETPDHNLAIAGYTISFEATLIKLTNSSVGIDEPVWDAEKILIYPNPASEKITVQLPPQLSGPGEIIISDILGKEIMSIQFESQDPLSIDLSSFEKGIYFVKIKTSKEIITKKIVLE